MTPNVLATTTLSPSERAKALRAEIQAYLVSRGWVNERPGLTFAWRSPNGACPPLHTLCSALEEQLLNDLQGMPHGR